MNIDVATHELAEKVSNSFKNQYSIDQVLLVIRSIGRTIENQLSQNKGIKLDKFGVFSWGLNHQAIFKISDDFSSQYKVKQRGAVAAYDTQVIVSKLNYLQLAKYSNIDREGAEKIYKRFIDVIGRCILEKKILLINFKVAEISIANNELSYQYNSVYETNASVLHTLNSNMQKLQVTSNVLHTSDNNDGKYRKRSASAIHVSRPRDRDPITGERDNQPDRFSTPKERNHFIESTDDINIKSKSHSIRSVSSTTSRNQSSMSISSNPLLRKESLERLGQSKRPIVSKMDARDIAKKALGKPDDIVDIIRRRIIERGGATGIKGLSRLLSIMDDNGDKRLSKDELRYGLRDYGISISTEELDHLFQRFDRDRNGFIDITEFLVGIKGDLNDRRRKLVGMAFSILDKDGSGVVGVDELLEAYDISAHPDVVAGKKSKQEAMREFMSQWDRRDRDGCVTYEEFEDYYKDLSASIDGDDYFELMMRNSWHIAGGEGASANTANKRLLVTEKDGSQRVVTVEKDLGVKAGDKDAYRRRLSSQGIRGEVELHGAVDNTEKAIRKSDIENRREVSRKDTMKTAHSQKQDSHMNASSNLFDVSATLKRLLYSPPQSLEQLAMKLHVSLVNDSPRMPRVAFANRLHALDTTLSKNQIQSICNTVDAAASGCIQLAELHGFLSAKFGKDKSSRAGGTVLDRVILKIRERAAGSGGIKGLARVLSIMDNSGDKRLSKEELKYGLQDYGIEINLRELDDLFNNFDRDRNGFIDITEFLVGIKGDLNDSRRKLVGMAFSILDKDGSGVVGVDELLEAYDISAHPDVLAGKKSKQEAMREFMSQWDRRDRDGCVTYEEFEDYYKDLSASIDGDDYFELMMRNSWRIAGGEGASANTANKRLLVADKDGSQRVVTVEKDLGVKAGDKDAYRRRLSSQGIRGEVEQRGAVDAVTKSKTLVSKLTLKPTLFEKNQAALKLAAVFRGRLGRKKAAGESRKAQALKREMDDELQEKILPKSRRIIRPKGKSYIGF